MVGAELPQRVVALHAVPADQDVLQRVVEGMAHVQAAGHVRRRDHDGKGRAARLGIGPGAEDLGARATASRSGPRPRRALKVFSIGIFGIPVLSRGV